MNGNRCEVCDDTNATIHCQECRRRTCEECDEILHLVDANKSHNRVPLFPSRGGSQVNSRGGSFAPTRNVSPRGLRRQEDAAANSAWPDGGHSAYDNNTGGDYPQPAQQQPVQMAPQRQAPPPPPPQQQNDYIPPPPQQQHPQRSQAPPPPEPKQPQYQPSNVYGQPAYQQSQPAVQQPQYRQPQQPYGQARSGYATPSGGMVGGTARSGYATPTYSQYPVPRSMTHSGAATPTYGQTGQRFVSAGAVPYNQLAPNQAPRLPTYDQKPMLDQPNPQQQAYLQHVELIQQHRAVEAHQRLMQQRNDQARHSQQHFHPMPNNTMQPAIAHPQRYTTSYVMSHHGSVVSSVAPSARNSPPMQPMQPRVAVPGLMHPEPAHQYREMGYARSSWPHPPQPQMNNVGYARFGQPIPQPVYGGYHAQPLYSGASSVTRTPYNEPRFMSETLSPSQYAQPTNFPQPIRTPYNEPRTPFNEPRTPLNEPRTPLNEPQVMRSHVDPRSPANEPAWMDSRFPMQRAAAQMPVRSAPEPPAYGRPMQQQPHKPQQPQYGAPVHSYAPHQYPQVQQVPSPQRSAPQRSAPMPPNNYSNYAPAEETGNGTQNKAMAPSWSNRYDPDEAEARVRNLIADTERMLAGLSSLSGNKPQKPSEGVSV